MMPLERAVACAVLLVYVVAMWWYRRYGRSWRVSRGIQREMLALPPLDLHTIRPPDPACRLTALHAQELDTVARRRLKLVVRSSSRRLQ